VADDSGVLFVEPVWFAVDSFASVCDNGAELQFHPFLENGALIMTATKFKLEKKKGRSVA